MNPRSSKRPAPGRPTRAPRSSGGARRGGGLRDRLRQATVDALLEATQDVLVETGGTASVAAIAERAGIAVGTLYNHFDDRDELIRALLRQRKTVFLAALDQAFDDGTRRGFEDALRLYVQLVMNHFEQNRAYLRLVLCTEIARHNDVNGQPMQQVRQRLHRIFELGVREGKVRQADVPLLAALLGGALRGVLTSYVDDPAFSFTGNTERIVDTILHGALEA